MNHYAGKQCDVRFASYLFFSDLSSVSAKLDHILESRDETRDATGRLSANVEHHLEKIWQRLDSQLESLTQRLANKAEENGMISALYKRQDTECREHTRELDGLRESTENQAHRIQDLEESLASLDAAQEENEETKQELEAALAEVAQLRGQIRSNEAAMAELQRTLDTRQAELFAEAQKYKADVERLSQEIQDKGAAALEAEAAIRYQVRAEMEGTNATTMKLLGESQQQVNSLVGQLENLKRENQHKEQSGLQDTATIRSLREALAEAEAKGESTAEQVEQGSREREELEIRLTSTVNGLEAQLDTSRDRIAELEKENRGHCARSEGLVAGLKLWAQQEGLSIHDLDCLGEVNDSADDISAGLAHALSRMRRGEKSEFFSTRPPWQANSRHQPGVGRPANGYAAVMGEGAEPEAAVAENEFGHDPVPYASSLHHMRRVVVCSPANVPDEPAVPSIDQEKARRREALQPKSILKRVTRSASNMMREASGVGVAGSGAFKRNKQDMPAGRRVSTGATTDGGVAEEAESIKVGPLRRSSKRRRSETAKHDNSLDAVGGPLQETRPETSAPQEARYQEQPSNKTLGLQPSPAFSTRRNSGAAADLHRARSGNARPALVPRQPNVRTYGSQRATTEVVTPGSKVLSRSKSQSQSQSRYWTQPKEESQESMTFSQGIGDENLVLSF